MPTWVWLYLAVYYAFVMGSFVHHVNHDSAPMWFVIAEGTMDTGLLITGVAYWKPGIVNSQLALLIAPMFVLGVIVLAGQLFFALRDSLGNKARSIQHRLFCGRSGAAFAAVVSGPLIFWGFQVAFPIQA